MGGFATLHLGLRHPGRARSLVVAACGYGAQPERQKAFREESRSIADAFAAEGAAGGRQALRRRPGARAVPEQGPRAAGQSSRAQLAGHSSAGSALTMRGVQGARPSLYDLADGLAAIERADADRRRRRGRGRASSRPHAEADDPGGRAGDAPEDGAHRATSRSPSSSGACSSASSPTSRTARGARATRARSHEHDGHGRARLTATRSRSRAREPRRGFSRLDRARLRLVSRAAPCPTIESGSGGASGKAQASKMPGARRGETTPRRGGVSARTGARAAAASRRGSCSRRPPRRPRDRRARARRRSPRAGRPSPRRCTRPTCTRARSAAAAA